MDPVSPWVLTPIGALCLVLATPYLLIARGKLIPKSTHDEIVGALVKQVAERDRRNLALEALAKNAVDQNTLLLDSSIPAVNAVFSALHRAAEGDPA